MKADNHQRSPRALAVGEVTKMIKRFKRFPSGSYEVEPIKEIETFEEYKQFIKELMFEMNKETEEKEELKKVRCMHLHLRGVRNSPDYICVSCKKRWTSDRNEKRKNQSPRHRLWKKET